MKFFNIKNENNYEIIFCLQTTLVFTIIVYYIY
jgi:hypothetical protein